MLNFFLLKKMEFSAKLVLAFLVFGVVSYAKEYNGYSVLRLSTSKFLYEKFSEIAERDNVQLDIWKASANGSNIEADIMLSQKDKRTVHDILKYLNIEYKVTISDVGRLIQKQNSQLFNIGKSRGDDFFKKFQRLGDIHALMEKLASENPSIASVFSIGKSYQGRDLNVIKIGSGGSNKPGIWIDGGIHAREWASVSSSMFLINQLVTGYTRNSKVRSLVDNFTWYILPVTNPDGYEYTHTNERMWRKTLSKSSGWCYGVDPNRNFGHKWNTIGASSDPCSEIFAGPKAFSESETQAVRDFLTDNKMAIYVALHAYGQYWMTPWGYTSALPDTYDELIAVSKAAADAIKKVHGKEFEIGTSTNVLYAAAGGSDDWAYASGAARFAFTVEVRDLGGYGFLLPPSQIIPAGEEMFAGFAAMAEEVKRRL